MLKRHWIAVGFVVAVLFIAPRLEWRTPAANARDALERSPAPAAKHDSRERPHDTGGKVPGVSAM